ncbi:M10 family metallopeptidase C-terminal domain-containing protein [Tsuneonella sp. HG222]
MDVIEPGTSGRAETDALVEGPKWAGTTITFSFPDLAGYADYGGVDEVAKNFEAFNAVQQAAVRSILTQISSFTGLTFVELSGPNAANATLRFAMSDEAETAYAYLPNPGSFGGDAWFNNSSGDHDNPMPGNYAWYSLMHEIGHALGLGHPHESAPPMSHETDWMPYTVMSYRTRQGGTVENYQAGDGSFAQTFMREDIAGLQFLYGTNASFRAGDTVYRWSETTGEMFVDGVGQGAPIESRIFGTLWDAGGIDTLDLSNFRGATVRLTPGIFNTFSPTQLANFDGPSAPGNIVLPFSPTGDARGRIENVIGGVSFVIHGNEADNHLRMVAGHNTLWGYDGNDWIEGGNDLDVVYGGTGNDRLVGNEGRDELRGEDGDDLLDGGADADELVGGFGNDYIAGGPGTDRLMGDEGSDRLFGEDLDDILDGGAGADYMAGGTGNDDYYIDDPDDVIFEAPGQGTDRVFTPFSYEVSDVFEDAWLIGTANAQLTGNAQSNILRGNAGNNIIDGRAGADVMVGAAGDDVFFVDDIGDKVYDGYAEGGFDTVYSSVDIVLIDTNIYHDPGAGASLAGYTGWANRIELVILTGSANLSAKGNVYENILRGNSGDNRLEAGNGNDILQGGAGADTLIGGAGFDLADYSQSSGAVTINLLTGRGSGSEAEGDTLETIEWVIGGYYDDTLVGDAENNVLTGLFGADTLIGGGGIDTASYESDAGSVFVNLTLGRGYGNASSGDTYDSIENVIGTSYNDFLIGDPGVNRLDGAAGDDIIIGAVGPDVVVGGAGADWASFEDNSGVVFINLMLARGFNNAAEGDTYQGVEHLIGGLMDDFFIGDDNANRLNGAMGADTLVGNGGQDIYMFTYAPGATSIWGNPNLDLILDFATGVDRIELSAGAFPGLPVGTLAAGAFWAGTAAHDGDDRILYDAGTGKLFFDPDGTGGQAALLFAVLGETSHPAALAASDFVVV